MCPLCRPALGPASRAGPSNPPLVPFLRYLSRFARSRFVSTLTTIQRER